MTTAGLSPAVRLPSGTLVRSHEGGATDTSTSRSHTLANRVIVAGLIASPCISLVAWVGVLALTPLPLASVVPVFLITGFLGLLTSIIGAQMCESRERDRRAPASYPKGA
jgi:hypothetical protein